MPDFAHLQTSCDAVLARHKLGPRVEAMCVVCGQRVCGQEGIVEHYIAAHDILLTPVDNIADLDGFFAHLRELLFARDGGGARCPVCASDCGGPSPSPLVAHVARVGHNRWDVHTIPTLAQFCISAGNTAAENTPEKGEGEEEEEEEYEEKGEGSSDVDFGGDWDVEPSLCLLCETVSEEPLSHMEKVHDFRFCAAVQAHEGVRDVYDIIRIINAIRRCVAGNICPYHYCDDSTEAEFCRRSVAACSLSEHLQENPNHILPRLLPSGDSELIPFLPGDAFISFVVGGVGLAMEKEEADPDYPMVPTLSEMVKLRKQDKQTRDTAIK